MGRVTNVVYENIFPQLEEVFSLLNARDLDAVERTEKVEEAIGVVEILGGKKRINPVALAIAFRTIRKLPDKRWELSYTTLVPHASFIAADDANAQAVIDLYEALAWSIKKRNLDIYYAVYDSWEQGVALTAVEYLNALGLDVDTDDEDVDDEGIDVDELVVAEDIVSTKLSDEDVAARAGIDFADWSKLSKREKQRARKVAGGISA